MRSRKRGGSKVRQSVQQPVFDSDKLQSLSQAMARAENLNDSLTLLLRDARTLLDVDTAFLAMGDLPVGNLYICMTSGIRTSALQNVRWPFGSEIKINALERSTVQYVKNCLKQAESQYRDALKEEGIYAGLVAPVQTGRADIGLLCGFARSDPSFTDEQRTTLALLGNLCALEISRRQAERVVDEVRSALV